MFNKSKTYKISSESDEKKDLPSLGIPKVDFMKKSSFNFLENERLNNAFEKLNLANPNNGHNSGCEPNKNIDDSIVTHRNEIIYDENSKKFKSQSELLRSANSTEVSTRSTRLPVDMGYYAPKRYTTTCYFVPKKEPVYFSEKCIITLDSKQKQYHETVHYETKFHPTYWSERTDILTKKPTFRTEKIVVIPEPDYHYLSLEPQQHLQLITI